MNHIQSVHTNVSSAQNSAAPVRNEAFLQAQVVVNTSKVIKDLTKFKDDLPKLDLVIKRYKDKKKSLEREKNGLYCATEDLRATRDKFHGRRSPMIERGYIPNVVSEKETFQKIRKHMNSAASSLYELTASLSNKASLDPKNLGVIGFVATLGKVDDGNISRLLSEFLGKKIMMAVVCDTIKSAKDLDNRVNEGLINKNMETHKLGEAIGQTTNEQFPVICLERLSPYVGELIADDPQRRLDLPKPRLPGGGVPRGFLGFAVNMIFIDGTKLFSFTPRVNGLRETLFYSLFKKMQVYRSEEDMQHALPYMTDGAISLDGGIIGIKDKNIVSYKVDPDVVFPKYSGLSCPPVDYLLLEAQIKEKEMQQEVLLEELQSVNEFLEILIKVKSRLVSRENTIQKLEQMSQSVQLQVLAARQRYLDP